MSRKPLQLDLPGLLVAPLTPFTPTGGVDWPALQAELDYIIATSRPAAISAAAVEAQEYQYLTFAERQELIRRTVEFVGGRVPVIIGVSHPAVRQAAELCQLAAKLGAAAVQVLIPLRPSGGPATLKEILAYFNAIAAETELPIVAYHNPGPGAELGPADMTEIARLEAVQAFKESSRNLRHIGRMIENVERTGLARYLTTMEVLLASLELGGSGGTMPPPGSTLGAQIIDAFKAGRWQEAAAIQQAFAVFPFRWMGPGGLTAAMKAACNLVGVDVGDPYPPFAALNAEEQAQMRHFLQNRTSLPVR